MPGQPSGSVSSTLALSLFVTHAFADATKGAVGVFRAKE